MERIDSYRVVLEIDVVGNEFLPPRKWDWPVLLDMLPDQVRLIEAKYLGSDEEPTGED